MKNHPLEIWRAPYLYNFEMSNDSFIKEHKHEIISYFTNTIFQKYGIIEYDWHKVVDRNSDLWATHIEKSKIPRLQYIGDNIKGITNEDHYPGKIKYSGIYLIAIDHYGNPIYYSTQSLIYYKNRNGYLGVYEHIIKYVTAEIEKEVNDVRSTDTIYKYNFKKDKNDYSFSHLQNIGKISQKKTFDVLFYTQKNELIHILDKFKNGTMYPSQISMDNKLGILLYGPPGTGKTGTISAIANYLKRNITIVNFTEINTTEELDKILDPQRYNETVFVFDEFDCITDVLGKNHDTKSEVTDWGSLLVAAEGEERKQIIQMMKDGKRTQRQTLNITYLLQKLDGLESAEGRVIIATTNNPDRINAALLRPGRFDIKLCLGNCTTKMYAQILQNYYKDEKNVYKTVIEAGIPEMKYSPLELINMAMQNSFEDLIKLL
jgi:hypothetical protein